MHTSSLLTILTVILLSLMHSGCTSIQTFTNMARPGMTISAQFNVAGMGSATRDNTIIAITDANDVRTVYYPGDPRIKAILNLYPDPVSYVVVGTETYQDLRTSEIDVGGYINSVQSFKGAGSRDWYQKIAYFDLPENMVTGLAKVAIFVEGIQSPIGNNVYIIEATPETPNVSPHSFEVTPTPGGPTALERFQTLERAQHTELTFTSTNFYSIEIKLSHDPDVDHGGQGRAYISNPRGDLFSVNWNDTGTQLHAIITPTFIDLFRTASPRKMRFFIAGGITGLTKESVLAVDGNGIPVPDADIRLSPLIHSLMPMTPVSASEVTINGDNLCAADCIATNTDVWVKMNEDWIQVVSTSVSQSAITLTMLAFSPTDNMSIYVETGGGRNSFRF